MKRREAIASTIAGVALLSGGSAAYAQGWRAWRGSGGWSGGPYQRLYNPQSAYTAAGTIESIESFVPAKGMAPGLHMMVKTATETVDVHLGPVWYLERLDVKLAPGDSIQLSGSRVTIDGKPAVIAAEIRKGDRTLTLRDASGIPVWAGWRR